MSLRTMILPPTTRDAEGNRVYDKENQPRIYDLSYQFGQDPYGGFVTIGPGLSTLVVGPLRESKDLAKKVE